MTPAAFAAAYERHRARLVAYCARRVGDAAAEDVAQQAWCEAWEHRERYEDRGWPITAWLYRIAQSRCVDYVRHHARRPSVPLDDRAYALAAPDVLGLVETAADVAQLVARVKTPGQRRAMALRIAGLTLDEAAAVMDTTRGGVKALIYRAREQIRAGAVQ